MEEKSENIQPKLTEEQLQEVKKALELARLMKLAKKAWKEERKRLKE